MERKVREMTKMDITATYRHEYSTKFIIDESADFSRLAEMNLEPYERIFFVFDKNVSDLYRDKIIKKMNLQSKKVFSFDVVPEERSKSIAFYPETVYHILYQNATTV